jgi:uncharacterized MnhB-related membrane protein
MRLLNGLELLVWYNLNLELLLLLVTLLPLESSLMVMTKSLLKATLLRTSLEVS